jgi:TatD DNase family protein
LASLADSHCHLDFNLFDPDRDAVLERALSSGVERMLNPGVDLASSRSAIELAGRYEPVYVAVGVHPNDALTWDDQTLAELRRLAQHPKVSAIGEIGLDYYRKNTPPDWQRRVFRMQLELAGELGLPVVIHSRESISELLPLLSGWVAELARAGSPLAAHPGVLHSFSADLDSAREAISLGFFIGFTGPVTFPKAHELRQVVTGLPLESILIETDAPFLAPQEHRGERNEPSYVRFVADKIAQLHGRQADEVCAATYENARLLFKW